MLNIKGGDIEDTPTFGTSLDTAYILGMAKMEGGVKILLESEYVGGADSRTVNFDIATGQTIISRNGKKWEL